MKKIVGMIAAAALAATAFAEINIGSWNRGVFVPFAYDGDTLRSLEGPSWEVKDAGGVRTGLSFSASTENAGMVFDIHGNTNSAIAMGDNAYTWVKPVDMLTLKFGQMDNNWGRLDHCFGTWDYWRFGIDRGEGLAGVERTKGRGAEITLQPVEGLVIDYEANFKKNAVDNHAYTVLWENSSTMIGYQADFGFIRAIINGQTATTYKAKDTDTKPAAVIGLAADITSIENLTLKVGASMPTVLTKADSAIKAAVAGDYSLDVATIHAQVNLDVLAKKQNDDKDWELGNIGLNIGAGVDYKINDALTAIVDVRYQTYTGTEPDGADKVKLVDPAFGGYVGLQQQLSNASFAFGAMFGKRSMSIEQSSGKADDFTFAIPLTMTVSF